MKSTITTSATALTVILAVGFLGCNAVAAGGNTDPEKNKNKFEHEVLELDLLKDYYFIQPARRVITYNFYDAENNLVYTTSIKDEETPDPILSAYLNKSDYLIDYQETAYFKID